MATWEGYDHADQEHSLTDFEDNDIYSLYKTQMSQLLPLTNESSFKVKAASTVIKQPQVGRQRPIYGIMLSRGLII